MLFLCYYEEKIKKEWPYLTSNKQFQFNDAAWDEEDRCKDTIYEHLDHQEDNARAELKRKQEEYCAGAYEDQERFIPAGELKRAQANFKEANDIVEALQNSPYYCHAQFHTKLNPDGIDKSLHFLLSGNEQLSKKITFETATDIYLIAPFSDSNKNSEIVHGVDAELLHKVRLFCIGPCDQELKYHKAHITGRFSHETTLVPQIVRNVEIQARQLQEVNQIYPIVDVSVRNMPLSKTEYIPSDDLLARKLQKNRLNAQLKNIISTLQRKQYEIIQSAVDTNFVVQGCAGSGKTQCLIHRLFFLRGTLSEIGWDKVCLITPTQLFRNYSSPLMKRYHLTSVNDLSIAELYYDLLLSFDKRFGARQYQIELTEEYLPDEYLQVIYSPNNIVSFQRKIEDAIYQHVSEGCKLVGMDLPEKSMITTKFIKTVEDKLVEKIDQLSVSPDRVEYEKHETAVNEGLVRQKQLLEEKQAAIDKHNALKAERTRFDKLLDDYNASKKAVFDCHLMVYDEVLEAINELEEIVQITNTATSIQQLLQDAASYSACLYRINNILDSSRDESLENKEFFKECEEEVQLYYAALMSFTGGRTEKEWLSNYDFLLEQGSKKLETIELKLKDISNDLEWHTTWISKNNSDYKKSKSLSTPLERERRYLSSIERSVFEQEIWKSLVPIKEKYGVPALHIEKSDDTHSRQERILYKFELLLYLMIYSALHASNNLPDYNLICIDEAQDLNMADYELLRQLYPRAALNIFGDINQLLHKESGLQNWRTETGISEIFELNSNYRNTPAIVDFCNKRFGTSMQYVGSIQKTEEPEIICTAADFVKAFSAGVRIIIVKDKIDFEHLSTLLGEKLQLTYLDTTSAEELDTASAKENNKHISCISVFAAKGLEFESAIVYGVRMSRNQLIVACTRAMNRLYYFERNDFGEK